MTPALKALTTAGLQPKLHKYRYVERGGTAASSSALGIDEHRIVKTLVFETSDGTPFIILMHGDRLVSAKALARHLGVRSVKPCPPAVAQRHSGYRVGGTSPFGTQKQLAVYVEASILEIEMIIINAGRRGLLMEIPSSSISTILRAEPVQVSLPKS